MPVVQEVFKSLLLYVNIYCYLKNLARKLIWTEYPFNEQGNAGESDAPTDSEMCIRALGGAPRPVRS